MNKSTHKNSFRYSRTPYSAENVKNTRLHRAAARLGVSFRIFISNLSHESDAIILRWVL